MPFCRYIGGAAAIYLLSTSAAAVDPSLDDIFNVRMSGDGFCQEHHGPSSSGVLDRMFQDMQKIMKDTHQVVSKGHETGWDDKTRDLGQVFLRAAF